MKRLVLLGGEGFIGRTLAEALQPDFKCISVDHQASIFGQGPGRFVQRNPYRQSLSISYDVIVHLIDHENAGRAFPAAEEALLRNIALTPHQHCVLFSSSAIYADATQPYTQRKLQLEALYEDYCLSQSIPLTIVRLFNVYGPYQLPGRRGALVATLLANFLRHDQTAIKDRTAQRDFLFAPDIGRALRAIIENVWQGKTDLGTGQLSTVGEIINLLETTVLKTSLRLHDERQLERIPPRAAQNNWDPGFTSTPLDEGLRQTWNFYAQPVNHHAMKLSMPVTQDALSQSPARPAV